MKKRVLNRSRIRTIDGSFAFIPHRFLTDGFLEMLSKTELLVYLFLVLAADANGLSYYGDKRICRLLQLTQQELGCARDALIELDMIEFETPLYQVLELPYMPAEIKVEPSDIPISSFSDLFNMMED